jgi:hypothetical protein
MGGDNVDQLWQSLCLIKAVVTLFAVSVIALLFKRLLLSIPWNRVLRRSTKHPVVHSLGTAQPPRKAPVLDSRDIKRHIG